MIFTQLKSEKSLTKIIPKQSGRDNSGRISMRHQGGRSKRYFRVIDFYRDKLNITGEIYSIEYDPNRTAYIALVNYSDGDKRYILLADGLKVGSKVISGEKVDIIVGNALPLKNIPIGTLVHNVELKPGKGAQIVRSAGTSAQLIAKEEIYGHLRMPSGEVRRVNLSGMATVGRVSNVDWKNKFFGRAGAIRNRGIRPTVRGVAQNPHSHPHGGGEGRSGIGLKSPKSPWGKRTLGKRTRKVHKYSDNFIIQKRKNK